MLQNAKWSSDMKFVSPPLFCHGKHKSHQPHFVPLLEHSVVFKHLIRCIQYIKSISEKCLCENVVPMLEGKYCHAKVRLLNIPCDGRLVGNPFRELLSARQEANMGYKIFTRLQNWTFRGIWKWRERVVTRAPNEPSVKFCKDSESPYDNCVGVGWCLFSKVSLLILS